MTKLLSCPFCASTNIDPKGWASTDRAGPACDDCGGTADTVELWNKRPGVDAESERLRSAVKSAHAAFEAIPIGRPLEQNGRPIDHTLLNEAKRQCESALSLTSQGGGPAA